MMQYATDIQGFTCICCPLGCQLEVAFDEQGKPSDVTGYSCQRGRAYALEEATNPVRMVTSLVYAEGCAEPLSVKTERAVPKAKVQDVLSAIRGVRLKAPVEQGEVVLDDAAGTGVAVIATKSLTCV